MLEWRWRAKCLALGLSCFSLAGCYNPLDEVSKSHVEANVPPPESFDKFLARDLNNYFCAADDGCDVKYELLRKGPTQSGVAYPKYYLWVKVIKGSVLAEDGAARVAAVDQQGFRVTNFLSRQQIVDSPSRVGAVFPAALTDKIVQKAHETE